MAKKKDTAELFERLGADKRFLRVYMSMLTAPRWKKLSKGAQVLYIYMKAQYYSKNTVEYPTERDIFYFNDALIRYYELYTNMSQYRKDRQQLIDNGFIEVVEDNHLRKKKNIYKFSDRWKAFGNEKIGE